MSLRRADMESQTHRFQWRGIEIEVIYAPLKWNVIAHLEVRSTNPERTPLPIAETGYLSHFHPPGTVEARGGDVIAQVRAWLDEQACKPDWRNREEASRQGELF